nr:phospholipase-like protein [Tanacetum cinerariifolium]
MMIIMICPDLLYQRVFPYKIRLIITNLDVISVIEDEETFGKLSDEDAIRLSLLLALEVNFMGRLLTFKVDDTLFKLAENLEAWNSFPWEKWLNDRVIRELNFRVFKLKTIIQVFAHKRNDGQDKLQFNDEFSSMSSELCDSLNRIFVDLIHQYDSNEDIAQELRLCLEEEERLCCAHEKLIVEEKMLMLEEANRLRLEEEKMLQLVEEKNKKHKEFMNSTHVWLTDDIERLLGQPGQVKCKFSWSYDYTVDRNFRLKLVCLNPTRKGWLTNELLLQNGMPLFYANGDRYVTPWSEVDQFHILSGEVTFYDSGDTYDYDFRLGIFY